MFVLSQVHRQLQSIVADLDPNASRKTITNLYYNMQRRNNLTILMLHAVFAAFFYFIFSSAYLEVPHFWL
jgi:hypothetical protein